MKNRFVPIIIHGLQDWLAQLVFFHDSAFAKEISRSQEYLEMYPIVEDSYANAFSWHGTGRYKHENGGIFDILDSIMRNNGLVTHNDEFDITIGKVPNISLATTRMYAALYAKMFFEEGKSLQNQYGRLRLWAMYFLGQIPLMALAYRKEIKISEDQKRRSNEILSKATNSWIAKVTAKDVGPIEIFEAGSDIVGNYPILFGIKDGAYEEAPMTIALKKHERRSQLPINLSYFTHIEVPLENVEETRDLLKGYGLEDTLPIIPMEYGEQFCRQFTFTQLVTNRNLVLSERGDFRR